MNHQRNMRIHSQKETNEEATDRILEFLRRGGEEKIFGTVIFNSKSPR